MSDEEPLELLKDAIENSKNTSEVSKEVAQIQRECYRELIKCKEKTMEQQNMITALEIEVKNLKEIVSKLEEKNNSFVSIVCCLHAPEQYNRVDFAVMKGSSQYEPIPKDILLLFISNFYNRFRDQEHDRYFEIQDSRSKS